MKTHWLWLFVVMGGGAVGFGDGPSDVSLETISAALKSAEDRCANLRFDCVAEFPQYKEVEGELQLIGYTKEEYRCGRKQPEGFLFNEFKKYEGEDRESLKLTKHVLNSFNGRETVCLDYRVNMIYNEMYIHPDFKAKVFSYPPENPILLLWHLDTDIRLADVLVEPEWNFTIVGQEKCEGVQAFKLVGYKKEWKDVVLEVWVAPDYGYMPVRHHVLNKSENRVGILRRYEDYVRLSNGVWFPQRIMGGEKDEWGGWLYKNINISPVPADFFMPEIPNMTKVVNRVTGESYLKAD